MAETLIDINKRINRQVISPLLLLPILMTEDLKELSENQEMEREQTFTACGCYQSCGSNFSRNGSCSCYTSCGSNYSK